MTIYIPKRVASSYRSPISHGVLVRTEEHGPADAGQKLYDIHRRCGALGVQTADTTTSRTMTRRLLHVLAPSRVGLGANLCAAMVSKGPTIVKWWCTRSS